MGRYPRVRAGDRGSLVLWAQADVDRVAGHRRINLRLPRLDQQAGSDASGVGEQDGEVLTCGAVCQVRGDTCGVFGVWRGR